MINTVPQAVELLKKLRTDVDAALATLESGALDKGSTLHCASYFDIIVGEFGVCQLKNLRVRDGAIIPFKKLKRERRVT